ncbi:MAG TPA: flagellar hook-basal body complex protein FliE [Clostridiaceae bacterium]|nr:flagellar hook-basal body complex protein FliE [Clostridiaceae bacterium]
MSISRIDNAVDFEIQNQVKNDTGSSFEQYLKDALDSANESQIKADYETTKLITGESTDIHNALVAAAEAKLQMQLIMEVRNKLVESYQEINRMQI